MSKDDGRRPLGDGHRKDFPGMDQHLVEDALTDVLDSNQAAARVQAHDLKMLHGVEPIGFAQHIYTITNSKRIGYQW